jgi:hypothetical protein
MNYGFSVKQQTEDVNNKLLYITQCSILLKFWNQQQNADTHKKGLMAWTTDSARAVGERIQILRASAMLQIPLVAFVVRIKPTHDRNVNRFMAYHYCHACVQSAQDFQDLSHADIEWIFFNPGNTSLAESKFDSELHLAQTFGSAQ